MQIQGGFSNIQRLQAQQAFNAKGRINEQQQAEQFSVPDIQVPKQSAPVKNIYHQLPMEEIKSIAHEAGYIGVTDADIERAYAYGESLLSDYTV